MKILLDHNAYAPVRAHNTDAGLDLRSPAFAVLPAHSSIVINTGVHVELPEGTYGSIRSKSGLAVKFGITAFDGTIDVGYTGAIVVMLLNRGDEDYRIHKGDKIAQLVVQPCEYPSVDIVDSLEATDRGDNGFGSTGR